MHVASDLSCKRCDQTIQRSFAKRFQAQAQVIVMMPILFLATALSRPLPLASLRRHAASRLCSTTASIATFARHKRSTAVTRALCKHLDSCALTCLVCRQELLSRLDQM